VSSQGASEENQGVTVSGCATITELELTGADLILEAQINAGPSDITVQASDSSESKLSVGATSAGGLHVNNAELNLFTTSSILTLGSNQTYNVIVNGATQTQSPSETKLVAENDVLFT